MTKLTPAEEDQMYENIECPKCRVMATCACEDLRRPGASQHAQPHKERIQAYRRWKRAQKGIEP